MLSAEKLLSLINSLGGIVWEADAETFRFRFVSQEAERILGYPPQQWIDDPDFWRRHTHPDDFEWCSRYCLEASREGRDHRFEYRMIRADGRIVWLRDIVSVVEAPGGGSRLVGIMLDITAQKEEEAGKQRLSRLYEALIENSSDSISLVRMDGVSVYQSSAIERQVGFTPEEIVGRNHFDHVHPDDVDMTTRSFGGILHSDGIVGPIRYRACHKDGSWRILESVGKRFTGEDGTPFIVANTRDVTEVVNAQRELEATQEQLAQAMKMEAVGRLAGGVAHDFNNLLTVIAGYAELVSASLEHADPRSEDLAEIKRAAHRASLLTRQLLTFSRKQVVRPEVLNLNAVVTEVGVLIRRLIGEDIQLEIQTCPGEVPVFADRSQLEQVLMNLAVNARDAMPLGGRLVMRIALAASGVTLTVSDTGNGMSPDVAARIFEPFFTTKEIGKGTGLGLSTAYGIVKQSGGAIRVTSEPGKGCCFTISLPLARRAEEELIAEIADMPRGQEIILLVEDEDQVRSLVGQVLSRLGYTVLTAPDGIAAMDICRGRRRDISLLLTDIVMAQISGPQVYARVADVIPGLAVLYMSGYAGDTVFARGVRDGEVPFLQKPFTPVALARKVREVLDRRPAPVTEPSA
jgi:two-component system cell cycle sensor histidine kinase/response regulator CckA